jgi:Holliday junction resolvase RusA-like endonuclease
MQSIVIEIPMIPKAQKRARSRIAGKSGRQFVQVYTDKDQRNEQENFRAMLFRQLPEGFQPIQGAITMWIYARFPIPKCSRPKMAKYLALEIPHIGRPDVDNLAKHVKDCCKGVVWLDDKQVTSLTVAKNYHPEPGWKIRIDY